MPKRYAKKYRGHTYTIRGTPCLNRPAVLGNRYKVPRSLRASEEYPLPPRRLMHLAPGHSSPLVGTTPLYSHPRSYDTASEGIGGVLKGADTANLTPRLTCSVLGTVALGIAGICCRS